ncbi:MAG TPA: L-threonine 3-dehydrogenase [Candidatus Brocadiia bacterium]|nr:L-threonine 3-dehydrogenase [Candidatus Brocadiia bacterium]
MAAKMRALVKSRPGEGLWMEEVPVPEPGINDVLIQIHKTAICGTDVHIYEWDAWSQKHIKTPMTIGHEFAGVVAAVGSNVRSFKPGDVVSGEGHLVCGLCRNCLAGRRHLCPHTQGIGVDRDGAFAEYLCIPVSNVWGASPAIPMDLLSIFDPLGNATHVALSFDLVGEDVLITGAGPIGCMAAAIARHVGARYIVVTDVNPWRLELAKRMGATMVVDARTERVEDAQKKLGMKEGFDVGFEMSGNPDAFRSMLANLCHGARVALLGILPPSTAIDWDLVIFNSLLIKGIYGREMFETWYKMTTMIQSGLDVTPVITHHFPVDRFQEGFDAMRSRRSGKVVLEWK